MLTLTVKAAEHIKEILDKQKEPDAAVRLFVKDGGCSGLQYGMTIDRPGDCDLVYEFYGARVMTDHDTLPLIDGSEIDYEENLMGGGFRITNPQAVRTCGCGTSFRTATTKSEGAPCGSQN